MYVSFLLLAFELPLLARAGPSPNNQNRYTSTNPIPLPRVLTFVRTEMRDISLTNFQECITIAPTPMRLYAVSPVEQQLNGTLCGLQVNLSGSSHV